MDECKLLERPDHAWQALGLASSEWWLNLSFESSPAIEPPSRAEFVALYETPRVPVVVKSAVASFTLDSFDHDLLFRVSDLHGGMVELRTWVEYARTTLDDAPLSLYDSGFFDEIKLDYDRPSFVYRATVRPYRWLLMGGPRSGTPPHVDPLGTHAWVHLCTGKKLWLLLPPGTSACEDLTAAEWFFKHHREARQIGIEIVQVPGQLVFVPAGWIHAVLNLEFSIAVTENYGFDLDAIRAQNPRLAEEFLANRARVLRLSRLRGFLSRDDLARFDFVILGCDIKG